ncbi:phosphopentomutase [Lachnospiraceae bacterium oral taxon 500]|nr:phosphopentomutase [Lachnospiraceae bacterium oral taxon 500]
MRYILLLRGVNVGGKNKVSMSDLKELLLNEGFEAVDSYINSGNLFFSSAQNWESCIAKITYVLESNYDFSIPFALITREEYLEERAGLPDWWEGELARRDVLFFSCNLDKSDILDFIDKSTFHNEIVYVGKHAVFWGKYDESEYLKTTYHKKLMKQDFYKKITIRNGNTFEKIAEIFENER